ncbi:anti-sigma factor [Nocardia wallacei]|uniref:anti-sigma factor n=1 Tax=Nocardia wallacei TaxID=480035 RepID=UPI002455FE40|nr:anti-sigma factor [Nocardia wallacei]
MTETIALLADFGIDEVTDIRLATEEVATALVRDAVPGSELDCSFRYDGAAMDVLVSAVTGSGARPDPDDIGWHIVSALTDTLEFFVGPYDYGLGGYPTVAEFHWTRGGAR